MQEISGIISGQIYQSLAKHNNVKPAEEGASFLNAVRAAGVASEMAISDKGSLEEMYMRKKAEVDFDYLGEDSEEEGILDVLAGLCCALKKINQS